MTIFLIGSPYETAEALDSRRLNKQIIECQWIINMSEGKTKASNHPAYLMWKDSINFVKYYKECLQFYQKYQKLKKEGSNESAELALKLSKESSKRAENIRPNFVCSELFENFKKRLYIKDSHYYSKWKELGTSESNYYFVNGNWLKYTNGEKTIDNSFRKYLY